MLSKYTQYGVILGFGMILGTYLNQYVRSVAGANVADSPFGLMFTGGIILVSWLLNRLLNSTN